MEHWWNDGESGNPNFSEKNLSETHPIYYKSQYVLVRYRTRVFVVTNRLLTACEILMRKEASVL
jgi:hypothetical protein